MTDTTVSTTDSTTRAILNALEAIARKAGAAIMEIYESGDFTVDMKSDDSPLTTADRAAHAVTEGRGEHAGRLGEAPHSWAPVTTGGPQPTSLKFVYVG